MLKADIDTVSFIGTLNHFAERTAKFPIMSFQYKSEEVLQKARNDFDFRQGVIFYNVEETVDIPFENAVGHPIVCDMCLQDGHDDIVSCYDNVFYCRIDDPGDPVQALVACAKDSLTGDIGWFIVADGQWAFSFEEVMPELPGSTLFDDDFVLDEGDMND